MSVESEIRAMHDEFSEDFAAALGRWMAEQTFHGTPIKDLRLQPAEETLTESN